MSRVSALEALIAFVVVILLYAIHGKRTMSRVSALEALIAFGLFASGAVVVVLLLYAIVWVTP